MWSWDFGDGSTDMTACPTHTYARPGSYTVKLTASSQNCESGEKTAVITVGAPAMNVDFTGVPTSGIAPLTVQFTDRSTGNPTMWSWDFGDGGTDSVANPVHTYAKAGSYTVKLSASNQMGGSGTKVKEWYVTVSPCDPIVASFNAVPTSGTAPLTVQFTDQSTGKPTMWSWDFGDGTTGEMLANPSHTYTRAGVYTVKMTASNQCGSSDTAVREGCVTVSPACSISADFVGTPVSGAAPLTVQFTDKSTGNPTMWKWDFGDGVIPMDTNVSCSSGSGCDNIANPVHTYLEPGTYTVTMTASNQDGCTDTEIKQNYIVVSPGCVIKADFTGNPISGDAPLKVQFTDQSTGSPTMWKWDFGDGAMPLVACEGSGCDNVANPYHTYLDPGTYTVTLTASNQKGCSDTKVKQSYITVGSAPVKEFIPLSPGWNFVSVPKKLAPGCDTASIFSAIDVQGHSIFQYDGAMRAWDMLNAGSPVRPLDSLWIYSSKADKVPLTYDPTPGTPTKMLKKGWNGIGFTGLKPVEAKYTLQSVADQWVNCAGYDATLQRYNPMIIKGNNDATMLSPYNGYWLYMSADGTLAANPA
jgi:PKD repeat protein